MTAGRIGGPGRWDLLIPAGWASLPTSVAGRQAAIRRVTDRMMRGQARDQLVRARIEIERSLLSQLESARQQGASVVHALVEPIAGMPVSASLSVAELTITHGEDVTEGVLGMLGRNDGVVEHGPVEIGGCPAIRRRRRHRVPEVEDDEGAELWATTLDVVVKVAPDTLLVLTFVTTTDPVADALVAVFDAIAASLRRA